MTTVAPPEIALDVFNFPSTSVSQNTLPTLCLDNGVYNLRMAPSFWKNNAALGLATLVAENRSLLDDSLRLLMDGKTDTAARVALDRRMGEDYCSAMLNKQILHPGNKFDTLWLAHRKLLQPLNYLDPLPTTWPEHIKTLFLSRGWPVGTRDIDVETVFSVEKAAVAVYDAELCTGSRPVLNDVCYHACTGVAPSANQATKLAAYATGGVRPRQDACRGASTDDKACRTCDTAAVRFCQATGAKDETQRPFLDPLVLQRCSCLASPLLSLVSHLNSQSINTNTAIACVDGGSCGLQGYMTQMVMEAAKNCGDACHNLLSISAQGKTVKVGDVTQTCRILKSDDPSLATPFQGLTFTMTKDGQLTLGSVVPPSTLQRWLNNVKFYVQYTVWTPTFSFPPNTTTSAMLKANQGFLILMGGGIVLVFICIALSLWLMT
jgi:hypothetical protein